MKDLMQRMDTLIARAVDETNRLLLNPPEQIRADQLRVVDQLPRGMKKANFIRWERNGNISVLDKFLFQAAEEHRASGASDEEIDNRILSILKSIIVRYYYIVCLGYRQWRQQNTVLVSNIEEIGKIGEALSNHAERLDLTFHEHHLAVIDQTIEKHRRAITSLNFVVIAAKYGCDLAGQLEQVIPILSDMSLPADWPPKKEFQAFVRNKHVPFLLKTGTLSLARLIERSRHNIFPELPHEYALFKDYRFLYLPKGVSAQGAKSYPPAVKVHDSIYAIRSNWSSDNLRRIRCQIAKYNKLIDANFAGLELMFSHANTLTPRLVDAIMNHLGSMIDLYGFLAAQTENDDSRDIRISFEKLREALQARLARYSADQLIPQHLCHAVTALGGSKTVDRVKTLNEMFNYVHIRSFRVLDSLVSNLGKDYFFSIKEDLKLIDTNDDPWIDDSGRIMNPLIGSVLFWSTEETEGRLILFDNSLWSHIRLGDHSAVVYARPAPPDEGGLLSIAYAEAVDNRYPMGRVFRVTLVRRIFEQLKMRVSIRGNYDFLQAVLDKESGIETSEDISSAYHMAMSALNLTRNIDIRLNRLLDKDEELNLIANEWADIFLAEGRFPFMGPNRMSQLFMDDEYIPGYVPDEIDYDKYLEYRQQRKRDWPGLGEMINRELKRLGLPRIPVDREMIGQYVIDKYFNRPVKLALEREDFIMVGGQAERKRDHLSRRSIFHNLALEPVHVLIACTGNTCRSNMAEQIMKFLLVESGEEQVRVFSRGVFIERTSIKPVVYKSLAKLGIPWPRERHVPTRLSEQDVADADIILVMTEGHRATILKQYPTARGKTYLLTEYGTPDAEKQDIRDPYGQQDEDYELVAQELKAHIQKIVERFKRIDMESLQVGSVARQLEGHLHFETIGGMGQYLVQRADMALADDLLDLFVLRDMETNAITYASAYRVKSKNDGFDRIKLHPDPLQSWLDRFSYPIGTPPNVSDAERSSAQRKLYATPRQDGLGRVVKGLSISAGTGATVAAPVTYRRDPGQQQGKIFVAPYTTPSDLPVMRVSAGVLTTGGGVLSHAAITAREFGIPGLIVHSAEWSGEDDDRHILLNVAAPQNYVQTAEGIPIASEVETSRIKLMQGDIVILDGLKATITLFERDLQAELKRIYVLLTNHDWRQLNKALNTSVHFEVPCFAIQFCIRSDLAQKDTMQPLLAAIRSNKKLAEQWRLYEREQAQLQSEQARKLMDSYKESLALKTTHAEIAVHAKKARVKLRQLITVADLFGNTTLPGVQLIEDAADQRSEKLKADIARELKELTDRKNELTVEDLREIRSVLTRAGACGISTASLSTRVQELVAIRSTEVNKAIQSSFTIPLRQLNEDYLDHVGGKSVNMGKLIRAIEQISSGLRESVASIGFTISVPDGFAVTTRAYEEFLVNKGIRKQLNDIASATNMPPADRANKLAGLLLENPLGTEDELGKSVLKTFERYQAKTQRNWFSVRSSAVHEDRLDTAYAGMGKTRLYVDKESLLDAITEVEASLWTERALVYAEENSIHPLDMRQAVVIQRMVDAEVSGVIFSRDPVTGRAGHVVINASYGLGEAIVSGLVMADQYITNKETGEETGELFIGTKRLTVMQNPDGAGVKTDYVDLRLRNSRALNHRQTKALTLIAGYVEDYFGYAVDIEFSISDKIIWLLQVRPITA